MLNYNKAAYPNKNILKTLIRVSQGKEKADLVVKNGRFLDVFNNKFKTGDIAIYQGVIAGIRESYEGKQILDAQGAYIVPGFIDAHVHLESSMLTPNQFQKIVMPCGTTTIIWDPHEITNIKGLKAIHWALESTRDLLLDIFVTLPSCVPSTNPKIHFEDSGAHLLAKDLSYFKSHPRILGLAEMMNLPDLYQENPEVFNKITHFNHLNRDGHCPNVMGRNLNTCAVAGINTCHESTILEEAQEKLEKGIHILIREGSCAKDASELLPLLHHHHTADVVGLCTDDRNPMDIIHEGHINHIINIGLKQGIQPEILFHTASFSTARIYNLRDRGVIAPGYIADFCLINPKQNNWLNGFDILSVFKEGFIVNQEYLNQPKITTCHFKEKNIHMPIPKLSYFRISAKHKKSEKIFVIGIQSKKLLTDKLIKTIPVINGNLVSDKSQDILKIAVFERHHHTGRYALGFVQGFGLKIGAIACTINHDSHNVIVVGTSDEAMLAAVNELIKIDGGIVVWTEETIETLSLPIGGLMTYADPTLVVDKLQTLKNLTRKMGSQLDDPFLQLAFLALPVIPSLKITDRSLIDVDQFKKIKVYAD